MKNALFYYYQINVIRLVKTKDYYYFKDGNYLYYLILINRPMDYINEVINLNRMLINTRIMHIIYNINKAPISFINNHYYILLRHNKNIKFSLDDLYNPLYCNNLMLKLNTLNHSNWDNLWTSKIDYFEYQKDYIKVKYPLLYRSLDYFIGLGENAITYFYSANNYLTKEINDVLVIARRRINIKDISFFNPLNLVIDHKARDVGEYLKYIFIEDIYNYELVEEILDNLDFSTYQYSLLMARLLFPSFYFDIYEDIVNGYTKEKEIIKILNRTDEYQEFLKYIYNYINKKKPIIKIDWLEFN